MVTLRSGEKVAALPADSAPSKTKKASSSARSQRSATPDRGSQDSTLRRSRRLRDQQNILESIQEDTAASAEVSPIPAVPVFEAAPLAPEDTPASTDQTGQQLQPRAQSAAEPDTIRDTGNEETSSARNEPNHAEEGAVQKTACSQAEAASSQSEDDQDLLAQLSESMWATFRPKQQQSMERHNQPSTSGRSSAVPYTGGPLRSRLPPSMHPQSDTGDEEDEMRWTPVTGLPEPLSAAAFKGAGAKFSKPSQHLEKQFTLPPRDTRPLARQARKLAPETAGKRWFDLPAPQVTDEVKRDLKLLQLRGTFDPKRFYKSSDHKKSLPKFFQIGTVVESPADFYSGRLTNNERKNTITEELLADPELSQARKRRFNKLQDEKTFWAKKRGRKTDLPRDKKNDRSKVKRMAH